ncbi:MAG: dacC [Gammaproteobacteria bacterium]|jgi:D-alanyl-D-alanine carboxypeptidase (penicillin-binding protein 5/6)|nr:dacC [Gammaproteobacteria bacterium]
MKGYTLLFVGLLAQFIMTVAIAAADTVIPIPTQPQQVLFTPGTPNIDAKAYILIDANSGKVLAEKNADTHLAPASLTKLMSLYVISGALKNGSIHPDDKVRISTKAWKTTGSRMFIKAGDEVSVKDLLQGIIVDSGNDATVAMAEHVAGTEETFTNIMNAQAKAMGMNNSHFMDSTGLPNPNHYSTARDLALLAQNITQTYPEDYKLFSEKSFTYNHIHQSNRNRLLWHYQYADGLKTGHTEDAGYCLVASSIKDGMRLISVIMGAPNDQTRTEDSIRLLTYGYRFFETRKLYNAGTQLTRARIWKGTSKDTALGLNNALYVTFPIGQSKNLQANIQLNPSLKAPIIKGRPYGAINIVLNNQIIASRPLVALENNGKGSLWRGIVDSASYSYNRFFSHSNQKANNG